jgi:hypothetical protein
MPKKTTKKTAKKKVTKKKPKESPIRNLVVISDIHAGCKAALCPAGKIQLDDGGYYMQSDMQATLWAWWNEFWEWVDYELKGAPFTVVCNGDALDGVHHNSVHQISHNLADQANIAYQILAPVVDKCNGNYLHVRGTEAHTGPSGQEEERLAQRLGAIPGAQGEHAWWEIWYRLDWALIHFAHHIGTSSSMAYETSAVQKELEQILVESVTWDEDPPDVVVRSHRHRCVETRRPWKRGTQTACVTPAWQLKTPFAWKIAGGRRTQPQIGGILIRVGDESIYTKPKVWSLSRPKEIQL